MADVTDAEQLTLVKQAIKERLQGGGYKAYSTATRTYQGESLLDLYSLKEKLERSVLTEPMVLDTDVVA